MQMINHMVCDPRDLINLLDEHHVFCFAYMNEHVRDKALQRTERRNICLQRDWKRTHGGNVRLLEWLKAQN